MSKPAPKVCVVVPNWNGADGLRPCLDSLVAQTHPAKIIVVDNGSVDDSVAIIEQHYPDIHLIKHTYNKGYAGGVNPGLSWAIEHDYKYVAAFNNDAMAEKDWLELLTVHLEANKNTGAAACKIVSADGKHLDSTGDYYTHWGLPYPRGRDEADKGQYDHDTNIFAASGGASLFRVRMLKQIGLFDEDFFAYYEDVDLSFRAQLAGWHIAYVPAAKAYHEMSVTGRKIKGFFTEMTMKNLPMLLWKNVPRRLLFTVWPRFALVYASFMLSAAQRGQLWYALKGNGRFLVLLPKKLWQRRHIQKTAAVNAEYIRYMLHWDLPPNATRWRNLRRKWWKLAGKS